jgi:hypothetical protein
VPTARADSVAEPGITETLRAAAKVMRATAERMEAILGEGRLSEAQLVERVGADVEVFLAAMATLDRELRPPG